MPKNLRIPDMSFGLSIPTIAFTLSGSTRQPDESIIWSKNLTDGFENSHFSLSVRPAEGKCIYVELYRIQITLQQPCNYYIASSAFSDFLIRIVYPIYNISHLEHAPEIRTLGEYNCINIFLCL